MTRMALFTFMFLLLMASGATPLYAGPEATPTAAEGEGLDAGMALPDQMPPPEEVMAAIESAMAAREQEPNAQVAREVEKPQAAEKNELQTEKAEPEPQTALPDDEIEPAVESQAPVESSTPQPSQTNEPEAKLTGYDRYRVIAQQNMFSRQRTPARRRSANASETEAQIVNPVVISLYILRGTALQGDRKIAFVEDVIAGRSIRALAGTTVLAGTIREIHIDHVVFEENEQIRDVKIGETFGKRESSGTSAASEQAAAPVPAAKPSAPTASPGQDELLKQMMERRNRELNR